MGKPRYTQPSLETRKIELSLLISDSIKLNFHPVLIKGYQKQLKGIITELNSIKEQRNRRLKEHNGK